MEYKIKTTGNHPYLVKLEGGRSKVEGEGRKVVELQLGEGIAVFNDACVLHGDGAQKQLLPTISMQRLLFRLTYPFSITSFRMDEYAGDNQYRTSYHASNTVSLRQTSEEKSSYSYCKYRFAHIRKCLSNKFLTAFCEKLHWKKLYHSLETLSSKAYKKVILDSNDTGDTYITHDATNNRVSIFVDGIEMVRINK